MGRITAGALIATTVVVGAIRVVGSTASAADTGPLTVKVMSFNILKPIWQKRGQPSWHRRKEKVFTTIRDYAPDLLGTQEENDRQIPELLKALPAYKRVGHHGQSGLVFYRHARWKPVAGGRVDFPKTPRYFLWVLFKELKTDRRVYFYTAHVLHSGQASGHRRTQAMQMIAEHIHKRKHPHIPVILTGDFNHTPGTEQMKRLTGKDGKAPAKLVYAYQDTLIENGGKRKSHGIDHILTTPGVKVVKSGIAAGVWDSGSDHPAVFATLALEPVAGKPRPSGVMQRLNDSRTQWLKLKAACGGNYEYEVRFQSWVGFGHTTTVVVRNDKVVERRFRKFNRNKVETAQIRIGPDGKAKPIKPKPAKAPEGWHESGQQLGSHKQGAAPKRIDALYDEAAAVLQKKLNGNHRLYLLFHKDGVLKGCFYVDRRIADDAPQHGPRIGRITYAKPPPPPGPAVEKKPVAPSR